LTLCRRRWQVSANPRGAIDEAEQSGDADTADVFTEISRETDKQLWFVEAHLYSQSGDCCRSRSISRPAARPNRRRRSLPDDDTPDLISSFGIGIDTVAIALAFRLLLEASIGLPSPSDTQSSQLTSPSVSTKRRKHRGIVSGT
jgi:hypothetical protein